MTSFYSPCQCPAFDPTPSSAGRMVSFIESGQAGLVTQTVCKQCGRHEPEKEPARGPWNVSRPRIRFYVWRLTRVYFRGTTYEYYKVNSERYTTNGKPVRFFLKKNAQALADRLNREEGVAAPRCATPSPVGGGVA